MLTSVLTTCILPVVLAAACGAAMAQKIVVANRGSGDLTVHRAVDGELLRAVPLPAAANPSEPMYVVQVGSSLLVGDRGNNRVVRFHAQSFAVQGQTGVGNGVWHMWERDGELWVNCDVDRTTLVIDTCTWQVAQTVPIPADLAALGYRPHDVFVGNHHAFVSLIGGSGPTDWIVQTSRTTFTETARAAVGKDPHLFLARGGDRLFVAVQNGNAVQALEADSLAPLASVPQPGAHGIFQPRWTPTLLVANFGGLGTNDLIAFDLSGGGMQVVDTISTNVPLAHNIAALPFGLRVAVTHSGPAARKVSLYRLTCLPWLGTPSLVRIGEVKAGVNPFGVTMVW